ncbi:MAG: hypothetical protein ACR2RE_03335 [Geminicoccaceae bacterium]
MTGTLRKLGSLAVHGIIIALVIAMLMPVVYMIVMSFRTGTEIAEQPLGLPSERFSAIT